MRRRAIQHEELKTGWTIIMEVFSPPRVSTEFKKMGYETSPAADIKLGWDLSTVVGREKLWKQMVQDRPRTILMEPVCRAFSVARASNWTRMDQQTRDQSEREGLEFGFLCAEVAM